MNKSLRKRLVYLAAALIMGSQLLYSEVTAGVLGTVVDSSGATLPNATVTLKHPETGLSRRAQTDASGSYEFLSVPVGENYSLQAEAPGFQTSVQTGIKLLVNQKYRCGRRRESDHRGLQLHHPGGYYQHPAWRRH